MLVTSLLQIRGPQGAQLKGEQVQTRGVVTATDYKGFFLESPGKAGELPTGIYVYTQGKPQVAPGDEVAVQARVDEYRPVGATDEEPARTQLHAARPDDVQVLRKKGLPQPVVLTPDMVTQETLSRLEGARVRVQDPMVVGPPNHIRPLADMFVLPESSKASSKGRAKSGGIVRNAGAEVTPLGVRMKVEHLRSPLNVGAKTGDLVGHIVFRFGRPQLQVEGEVSGRDVIPSRLSPEVTSLTRRNSADPENTLFIGSANVENKDIQLERPGKVSDRHNIDDDLRDGTYKATAKQIALNLGGPDIVALQEMQDDDGGELSDVVRADKNFQTMIELIVEAGGPRYEYIDSPPENGKEGGMPGGNIRNGFLYNPERVKLVPGSVERLEDPAFEGSRRPVIARFEFSHGGQIEVVTAMSVHNKSKRGGSEETDETRLKSSVAINSFARDHAPKNEHEHIIVLGDRNAYNDEAPRKAEIANGHLVDMAGDLPHTDVYTSMFDGQLGDLDAITAKTSATTRYDIVHVNSEFDDRVRPSDHDPEILELQFEAKASAASKS